MVRVIDCHVHINANRQDPVGEVLRMMDECGIDIAVVFPGFDVYPDNLKMAKSIKDHRDRLVPFAWVNPLQGDKTCEEITYLVEQWGFKGIKLHPLFHAFYPNRPYMKPIATKAMEFGLPILIHCGHAPYSTPWQVAEFATSFPTINVIMDHMGLQVGWVDDAISLAERNPNIILGTTAMPFHEKIKQAVTCIGMERVIFGSDAPTIHPLPEITRIKVSGLDAVQFEYVLGRNTERILGLEAKI